MSPVAAVEAVRLGKRYVVRHERRPSLKKRLMRALSSRSTETVWVLREVSFSVFPGEAVGIIGHNGVGKSTLLRLIAGILRPTEGALQITGPTGGLFELAAGFHPELSGLDNILLTGALMGYGARAVRRRLDRIIDFAELADFIDVPVKTYSSGMALRLGFSIVVAFEPNVVLVDEVLAVADERFQRKAYGELARLRERGSALFVVSHELGAIRKTCQRVLWLDQGIVRREGPTEEVIAEYLSECDELPPTP